MNVVVCFVVFRFSAKNIVIPLLVKHEKDERDSNFFLRFGHSFISVLLRIDQK